MKKEKCRHCDGTGEIEICERCLNTGYINAQFTKYIPWKKGDPGFIGRTILGKTCDNPDCKIKIMDTNQ